MVVVLLHQVESFLQVLHLTIMSHKDSNTWEEIYSFVHSLGVHIKFRMADGAQAIIKAGSKVFSSCPDCQYLNRLICWNHTIRVVQAKTKQSKKLTDLLPNHFSMILIIFITQSMITLSNPSLQN